MCDVQLHRARDPPPPPRVGARVKVSGFPVEPFRIKRENEKWGKIARKIGSQRKIEVDTEETRQPVEGE